MDSSDAGLTPLISAMHARDGPGDDMSEVVVQLQQVVKLLQEQKVCDFIAHFPHS